MATFPVTSRTWRMIASRLAASLSSFSSVHTGLLEAARASPAQEASRTTTAEKAVSATALASAVPGQQQEACAFHWP
jgi:hypothetical protein